MAVLSWQIAVNNLKYCLRRSAEFETWMLADRCEQILQLPMRKNIHIPTVCYTNSNVYIYIYIGIVKNVSFFRCSAAAKYFAAKILCSSAAAKYELYILLPAEQRCSKKCVAVLQADTPLPLSLYIYIYINLAIQEPIDGIHYRITIYAIKRHY